MTKTWLSIKECSSGQSWELLALGNNGSLKGVIDPRKQGSKKSRLGTTQVTENFCFLWSFSFIYVMVSLTLCLVWQSWTEAGFGWAHSRPRLIIGTADVWLPSYPESFGVYSLRPAGNCKFPFQFSLGVSLCCMQCTVENVSVESLC